MKNLLLIVSFLILRFQVLSQMRIFQFEGQITNNTFITDTLYVCKIKHVLDFYSGNSGLIIKKIPLVNGAFSFTLSSDSIESGIIRFNIQPKNIPNGATVQRGGSAENCWFLILENNDSIRLSADALDFTGTFHAFPSSTNISLRNLRSILNDRFRLADSISNLLSKSSQVHDLDQLKTIYYNRLLTDRSTLKVFIDTVDNFYCKFIGLHQMDIPRSLNDSNTYNLCRDMLISLSTRNREPYLLSSLNELLKTYDKQSYKSGNLLMARLHSVTGELEKINLNKRLTLIDFWASWCEPCRKANRSELQTLNNLAKTKNFEIISISLDKRRDLWLQASKKDKIEWKNYLDPLNFQSDYIEDLQIRDLPSTFLLDINGKIIARDIALPELIKLLK